MLTISKATKKETKNWAKREWKKVETGHFGTHVDMDKKNYRFKAVEDEKIVGMITGKYEGGVLYISQLITDENFRGRGIGSKLIKTAEDFGRKYNAHISWLITGREWSENIFYKKMGYKLIATIPNFYGHKDFVIYTKEVGKN
ncbi:GNAT family N-acetyltransferase [Patescibacteria group bacterium]|nr:GNAT family N-acetyltransferase [Patescibacteria group bacterium]